MGPGTSGLQKPQLRPALPNPPWGRRLQPRARAQLILGPVPLAQFPISLPLCAPSVPNTQGRAIPFPACGAPRAHLVSFPAMPTLPDTAPRTISGCEGRHAVSLGFPLQDCLAATLFAHVGGFLSLTASEIPPHRCSSRLPIASRPCVWVVPAHSTHAGHGLCTSVRRAGGA